MRVAGCWECVTIPPARTGREPGKNRATDKHDLDIRVASEGLLRLSKCDGTP